MKSILLIVGAAFSLALVGCAAKRPVLYPNAHFESVGDEAAKADVDACIQAAEDHVGDSGNVEKTAGDTAVGAATGSAAGAAAGAIGGDAGLGAAAGAVGGAVHGLLGGIFGSENPDPATRRYVERCLRGKGYEIIDWK